MKREAPLRLQDASVTTRKKDSVLNGGLIGAAIGGLAVPRAWLKVAPVPAIAGFAIGVLVDAMR
jgi:hypothetical protein